MASQSTLRSIDIDIQHPWLPAICLDLAIMPLGKLLCGFGDTLRHVYSPIDSIVSLLYVMEDGAIDSQIRRVRRYSQ
jgi:hypothetical protein